MFQAKNKTYSSSSDYNSIKKRQFLTLEILIKRFTAVFASFFIISSLLVAKFAEKTKTNTPDKKIENYNEEIPESYLGPTDDTNE